MTSLLPRLKDLVICRGVLVWSALIGFFVGVLPGAGATASTVFAYATAKRMSKTPEAFGKGTIEGVAAPEAANNSASYSAMIPLFTLGIPGSGTTAVMLGGLLMLGLEPGPRLFIEQPEFIWTLIGTFYVGNIVLVFLTLALVPLLAALVFVRTSILFPIVVAVVFFGIYSIEYSTTDVLACVIFGLAGYVLSRLDYPMLPVLLGVILGPLLERGIRRSLIISQGDISIFWSSAISATVLAAAVLLLVFAFVGPLVRSRLKRSRSDA